MADPVYDPVYVDDHVDGVDDPVGVAWPGSWVVRCKYQSFRL